jgi:hypothetical protein
MWPRLPANPRSPSSLLRSLALAVGLAPLLGSGCAEELASGDTGITPVDVNVDLGSDAGLSDAASDLPVERPATTYAVLVDDDSDAHGLLVTWGLSEAAADDAIDLLFGDPADPTCAAATPPLVAPPGRRLEVTCLPAYDSSGLRVRALAARITDAALAGGDPGDLVVLHASAPNGRAVALLQGADMAEALGQLDAALAEPAVAALVVDLLQPGRCPRAAQADLGAGASARAACQSAGQLADVEVLGLGLSLGPDLEVYELVALRSAEIDTTWLVGAAIPVVSQRVLADSSAVAGTLLERSMVPGETSSATVGTVFAEFFDGSGQCPARATWVQDDGAPVRVTWAPGPDLGVFRLCSARLRRVADDARDPDEVVTITGLRAAGNVAVQWLGAGELETATAAGMERAFVDAADAADVGERFAELEGDDSCEPELALGEGGRFEAVCRTAMGALPELGVPRLRSIRETGFDSASLIDVDPAPVSALFFDEAASLASDEEPAARIALHQPPRAISQALVEGVHQGALTARLISWGVPEVSAREALSRLANLIAEPDGGVFPLILEDEERALYFGRGIVGAEGDEVTVSYTVHGFREGGPELEVFVLADEGAAAPVYELRNPTESAISAAVLGALEDSGASEEVGASVVAEVIEQLAAGCGAEPVRIADEYLAGELVIACDRVRYTYPRVSLQPAGVLHIWFESDGVESDADFTLLTLDFVRAPLRAGGAGSGTPGPHSAPLADSLALLRPRFDAPALPGLSPPLLLRGTAPGSDAELVGSLEERGFTTAEARLVDGTLGRMLETDICTGHERVSVVADGTSVAFGCLRPAAAGDLTLYAALATDAITGAPRFTVIAPVRGEEGGDGTGEDGDEDDAVSVAVGLGELEAYFAEALAAGGFSADEAPGLAAILGLTPARRSCRERAVYPLGEGGVTLELACTATADLLGSSRAEGELDETGLRLTAWRVTRDGERVFFYTLDDPSRDGEETTLDTGVGELLARPAEE